METSLAGYGGLEQQITVLVAASDVALVGDGFVQVLTPPEALGSLDVADDAEASTYTVTLESEDVGIGAAIGDFLPGSWLEVSALEGDGFFRVHRGVDIGLGLATIAGADGVLVEHTVQAPWGQRIESDHGTGAAVTYSAPAGERTYIEVTGWTVRGLIVLGALVALALIGAGVLFLLRARIAEARTKARISRSERRASAALAMSAAGAGSVADPVVGAPPMSSPGPAAGATAPAEGVTAPAGTTTPDAAVGAEATTDAGGRPWEEVDLH